jgi:hypothetical protein
MNGCNKPTIIDKCGVTWNMLAAFNIFDGVKGYITARILRRPAYQETYLFFPGSDSGSNFVAE